VVDLQALLAAPVAAVQELSLTAGQYKHQQRPPHRWPAGGGVAPAPAEGAAVAEAQWAQRWFSRQCGVTGQRPGGGRDVAAPAGGGGADSGAATHTPPPPPPPQQRQQRQQQQGAPYNIWDHTGCDVGTRVCLYPQEIRTWLVTLSS
jgi:hypothetical protein